ncbi:MAG: tetratricopeptide repeat protein [Colwellia sp.]
MSSRKLFILIGFPLKVMFFLLIIVVSASAKHSSEQLSMSNQVQQLLRVNSEVIDSDTVKHLLETIISSRQHYSNEVIAKIFLLSARVASNQGDINKVLLLSEQGLAANSLDKSIKLSLLLKLAEVYVAKKQYKKLLDLTQLIVTESRVNANVKDNLLSLSYRSVAFSMLGKHQKALASLQKVEQGINHSDLTEHIELLTVLALAYHHLSDYQTSLTMQLKILKLRFEIGQKRNIDQTYLYLGYAYFYLARFDDAYNAFWESKRAAEIKGTPINIARAEKGLGIVLLTQKDFNNALPHLQQADNLFYQHNMLTERIESSVALAKVYLELNQTEAAYTLLADVIDLLKDREISPEFAGFYRMVAEMYFVQKNYQLAYHWRMKYSQVLLKTLKSTKKFFNITNRTPLLTAGDERQYQSIEQSKRLAVKLVENSGLSSSFIEKNQKQRVIIISLSLAVFLLLLILVGLFFRLRAKKINLAYEEIEKPSYVMAGPIETKFHYQLSFKKARNFHYPLSVGYLVIDNWQELLFRYNKKVISEVIKGIASVINHQITEFDTAGLLREGEYLLLFEHQNTEEVSDKLAKLAQAINSRAFASLGSFSVTVKYSLNALDFKDIDPYLFLARMAESINVEQVKHSKTP